MRAPRPLLALGLLAPTLVLLACGGAPEEDAAAASGAVRRPVVAVASGPAALLAEAAVGPDGVERVAPRGADMASWRPDDDALDAMVSARAVLVVGDGFEPWLQRAGLPPSRTVRLDAAVPEGRWIEVGTFTHTHGGGEAHTHGGVVAEAWTDPAILRAMAARSRERLGEGAAPDGDLERRIAAYEAALTDLSEALEGRALIATHHGLEYLCRAAGIELEVTELELDVAGAPPNDAAVRELEALAGREGAHAGVLVWPGRLDEAFARKARGALGLRSVDFDLGGALDERDTLERLTESTARLRASIPGSPR